MWGLIGLSVAQAAAPASVALLWGGGKTEAEGRAALEDWRASLPASEGLVRPAEAFPILVASDTVAGLNPGFWVVVVGYCAGADAPAAFAALRAVSGGVWQRPITARAAACPVSPSGLGPTTEARVPAGGELRATPIPVGEGCPDVLVSGRGADGRFGGAGRTEPERLIGRMDSCVATVEASGGSITVTYAYSQILAQMCQYPNYLARHEWTAGPDGLREVVTESPPQEERLTPIACGE